jgi:hypothetical protein
MRIESRLARLTPAQAKRRRRLMLQVLWVCAFALVPWTAYLAVSLPNVYNTRHWAVAWTGFDVLEIFALAATAYYAWRGRQALIAYAIAAATLLVCDAWFDITLDLGTSGIWTSLASAVFIELPLAYFLTHRALLLIRLTMLRFFPEGDADGKPIRLSKLPLLALLPPEVERALEAAEEIEEMEEIAASDPQDPAAPREPESRDTR